MTRSARRAVGDFRRAARAVTYQPRPAYLGWTGQGNLGDESILQAQQVHFGTQFQVVPPVDMELVLHRARRLGSRRPSRRLLLGGGTVVGRPEWLARLQSHRRVAGGQALTVWGAGVEDPDFRSDRQFTTRADLEAWASWLRMGEAVGVRGPRSAEILAGFGVSADVVGDPALRLSAMEAPPTVPGRVIVNLARPEATYADNSVDLIDLIGEAGRRLVAAGNSLHLFAMHATDMDALRRLHALVPQATVAGVPRSVQTLLSLISSADVVVSQRLHGNVLAAALQKPFVSLDYRPKCMDFADSVEMTVANLRPADISVESFLETLDFVRDGLDLGPYRRCIAKFKAMDPPSISIPDSSL